MPQSKGNIRITTAANKLNKDLANALIDNREFRRRIDDFALDEADWLQQNSPVGATGGLKSGWDVIPARRQAPTVATMQFSIINTTDNATYRIAGRGPGRLPPIEPIEAWALVVLGDIGAAWAIAKGIAARGTKRWRDKKNWVGIDNQGNIIPDGRIDTLPARLNEYLKSR
jgi:hypothetical protein